jgi:hypothetical protein
MYPYCHLPHETFLQHDETHAVDDKEIVMLGL